MGLNRIAWRLLVATSAIVSALGAWSPEMASGQTMTMDQPRPAADSMRPVFMAGATAIGLATRASPAIDGRDLTEGYLTQPMLMGTAQFPSRHLGVSAIIDLEGLTLRRGELNAGMYGEGYVDRRHPHTYLHEIAATWIHDVGRRAIVSATAGKGFAPFGTDDPMSRPLVKYPVNHHLAQILERAIIVGAATAGPLGLELARFNGDEPESPSDLPNSERLFDSWAARGTVRPSRQSEIQTSFARVLSPEVARGGGLSQRKWSASGRYETETVYGLAEWARTQEYESNRDAFAFTTMLAEASVSGAGAVLAARAERTERPEEERLADPFRTPRPATDLSILGRTRWTVFTLDASRSFVLPRGGRMSPFVEVARAHAAPMDQPSTFSPRGFYGSDVLWSFSAGLRFGIGMMHNRKGRYGAAAAPQPMKMAGMEMGQ